MHRFFFFLFLFCFYVGCDDERLLYNSCHDWCPCGSSFRAAISPDPFTPTARGSAKHSGPQIKMLGVGFQLPFSKPHSVVHVVCWCLASEWLCTGKFSRRDNPKMFSWAVLTCRSASVSRCLSLSILKQIALSSLFSIFSNPLTLTPITQRAPVASFQLRHWS